MAAMKGYSLGLLLVFFMTLIYAETLPSCSGHRTFTSQDAGDRKQAMLRQEDKTVLTSSYRGERAIYDRSHLGDHQEKDTVMSQSLRAKGVNSGDSMLKPKGKRNGAEATLTKSTSIALAHVTLATLALVLLY